jgi:hypothetical protein
MVMMAVAMLAAAAQTVLAQEATTPLPCVTLLTAAEIKTATGVAFEKAEPIDRGEGYSECSWNGGGGTKSVTLSFWEPRAMTSGPMPASSPAAYFEMLVKSAEEAHTTKREELKDIGQQAALVNLEGVITVFIRTPAGVAHVLTSGVTKEQTLAVAKASATQ